MSERLLLALDRLMATLTEHGSTVSRYLLPGIGADEVRARLAPLGLDPPPDLIALFAWHNGYSEVTARGEEIGPGFRLPTLDEACETYGEIREWLDVAVQCGELEHAKWFPVLVSRLVLMDCCPDSLGFGGVMGYDAPIPIPEYKPASLAEPLERWIGYIEKGVWGRNVVGNWVDYHQNVTLEFERRQWGLP